MVEGMKVDVVVVAVQHEVMGADRWVCYRLWIDGMVEGMLVAVVASLGAD